MLTRTPATYHLFIGNAQCHTIFLAATTDNGFARMLELYAYNDKAREKTILVHNGWMANDFSRLNFEKVEWANVFKRGKIDPHTIKSVKADASRRQVLKQKELRVATKLIFDHVFGLRYKTPRSTNTFAGLRSRLEFQVAHKSAVRLWGQGLEDQKVSFSGQAHIEDLE